jgi:hypothetical protein
MFNLTQVNGVIFISFFSPLNLTQISLSSNFVTTPSFPLKKRSFLSFVIAITFAPNFKTKNSLAIQSLLIASLFCFFLFPVNVATYNFSGFFIDAIFDLFHASHSSFFEKNLIVSSLIFLFSHSLIISKFFLFHSPTLISCKNFMNFSSF